MSDRLPLNGTSCSVFAMQPEPDAPRRRELMRQAACVAGAWAAAGALPLVAHGEAQPHPRSLLVDAHFRQRLDVRNQRHIGRRGFTQHFAENPVDP